MDQKTMDLIDECATAAHEGTMRFPDIVRKLVEAEVQSYRVDYLRGETVYYLRNDESHVVRLHQPADAVAQEFQTDAVAAAVRAAQTEALPYPEFIARTRGAGCTGYVAYLDGQRVVYSGRMGNSHTEFFPGSPGWLAQQSANSPAEAR